MTRRSSRLLSLTTFAALFGGLAFGCAANAPEAEGSAGEAITVKKCPAGFSPNCDEVCGPEDGCKKPIISCTCEADPPPPPVCLVNSGCTSTPKTTPGFDPVVLDRYNTPDPAFADALAAAGCGPQNYYYPGSKNGLSWWATAICPASFTESAADLAAGTSGVLSCDSCTGTPSTGQVVIAWLISAGPKCTPKRCPNPGAGCAGIDCLRQIQADESGGTP